MAIIIQVPKRLFENGSLCVPNLIMFAKVKLYGGFAKRNTVMMS